MYNNRYKTVTTIFYDKIGDVIKSNRLCGYRRLRAVQISEWKSAAKATMQRSENGKATHLYKDYYRLIENIVQKHLQLHKVQLNEYHNHTLDSSAIRFPE